MENLTNYLKSNIRMSLYDYLQGFLNDMVYIRGYQVGPHWRKRKSKKVDR